MEKEIKLGTCSVCNKNIALNLMIEVCPNSNSFDLICKKCNAKAENVSNRYPYDYAKSLEQFENKKDRNFDLNEKITTYKNIFVITNKIYHNILRDYKNVQYKVGTNTNNEKKEFYIKQDAVNFAKLISSTNTYEQYYVVANKNGLFYVIGTTVYNSIDLGMIVSESFYDYKE